MHTGVQGLDALARRVEGVALAGERVPRLADDPSTTARASACSVACAASDLTMRLASSSSLTRISSMDCGGGESGGNGWSAGSAAALGPAAPAARGAQARVDVAGGAAAAAAPGVPNA